MITSIVLVLVAHGHERKTVLVEKRLVVPLTLGL
jgi:hypothetical protein